MIRTIPLPDKHALACRMLSAVLERRSGQRLETSRMWRIESTLAPLLRELGLSCLEALAARAATGNDPALEDRILDALLNGETSFFRDAGLLDQLADVAGRLEAAPEGRRLRIWSAGCSTGQEPLSLAMLFAERNAASGRPMPEIRATDVSPLAIARARAGRFSQFEIQRGLPVRRMVRWFDADASGEWTARPELLRGIVFREHNLVAEGPLPGQFDLVLCRNVLFYLPPPLRRRVLEGIASVLRPDGLLMLGAGETVIGQTDCLVPSAEHRGLYALAPAAKACV